MRLCCPNCNELLDVNDNLVNDIVYTDKQAECWKCDTDVSSAIRDLYNDLKPKEQPVKIPRAQTTTVVEKKDVHLGNIALIIPVLGLALIHFWIPTLSMLERPDNKLMFITAGVVLVTAILIAIEASQLKTKDSPTMWFVGVCLLWIVFFPLYYLRRSKHGASNSIIGATIVALIYVYFSAMTHLAIEERKEEIRGKFRDFERSLNNFNY